MLLSSTHEQLTEIPKGNVWEFTHSNDYIASPGSNKRLLTTFNPDLQRFVDDLRNTFMTDQRWGVKALVIHDSGNLVFVYTHPDLEDTWPSRSKNIPGTALLLREGTYNPGLQEGYSTTKVKEELVNTLLEGTNLYAFNAEVSHNFVQVVKPEQIQVREDQPFWRLFQKPKYHEETIDRFRKYGQTGVVLFKLRVASVSQRIGLYNRMIEVVEQERQVFRNYTPEQKAGELERLQEYKDELVPHLVAHSRTLLHVKFDW